MPTEEQNPIRRQRLCLYFITWLGVLIFTLVGIGAPSWFHIFDPRGWFLLPFFPCGLNWVLGLNPQGRGIFDAILWGWAIYIGLMICGMKVRRQFLFWIIYALLTAVMIFNAIGCRKMNPSSF